MRSVICIKKEKEYQTGSANRTGFGTPEVGVIAAAPSVARSAARPCGSLHPPRRNRPTRGSGPRWSAPGAPGLIGLSVRSYVLFCSAMHNPADPRLLRLFDVADYEFIRVSCPCGRIVKYASGLLQRRRRIGSDLLIYDLQYRLRAGAAAGALVSASPWSRSRR
jgi:hypothetical protein